MSAHKPSIKVVLLGEGDCTAYLHCVCSRSFECRACSDHELSQAGLARPLWC